MEIYLIYCEHANQDTGLSRPSFEYISQTLGIRLDHVKQYDRELLTKLWVIEAMDGDKPARKVQAGWLSRKERTKRPCATQTLVNEPDQTLGDLPNVGEEIDQTLVKTSQDLGKSHQTLGTHIKEVTSQENQLREPAKKKTSSPAAQAEIPEWLPADTWARWVKHRKEIRKPLSAETTAAQFKKLDRFRARGQPPEAVIEQAIEHGWTGLYELKDNGNEANKRNTGSGKNSDREQGSTVTGDVYERAEYNPWEGKPVI